MDRAPQPSPQLLVVVANKKPQVFDLTQPRLTLGRAEDNDIVIASPLVSRLHAELILTEAGYQINTLPGTGNPLMFNGRPLDAPHRLQPGDTLRIGSLDPVMMVSLTYLAPVLALANQAESIQFGEKNLLQIGRDPTNEVVLESPIVSRFHAQIELVGQRYRIRDLRSSNGTFINGRRVDGEARLQPEDSIQIGPYRFVVGQGRIDQYDESGGVKVEAAGLNKWVRNDLNILQDISVVFQPREFIVVVGQSGGGKSTLVDAIAGYRPATHGQVWVNGMDVYHCFDLIRNDIGFVPQRDIIHTGLTVYQAFDYAAQLRMPPDTSPDERCKRIEEVLVDLDLTHRKDVQISGLSGGQLKRVSIGVELLTKPRLFFLDEPTSGLDPGTETALMQLMRRLADQGRTIVLITHATKNVMLADKIIFLARGGYLAWFGPPEEALEYFDQYRSERDRRGRKIEFDDIYSILDNPHHSAPAEWAKRYQELPAFTKYIRDPLAGRIQEPKPSPVEEKQALINGRAIRQVNSLRQFFILSARNLKILTRDRFSLALMLATPILVGLLDVLVSILLNNNPFDFNRGKFPDVITTLFLLILYGIMVGGLAQMREIVKERDIY
ncbi:MAG: FHA domain-containing protein, partial [Chloroflexota bacterium]